MYLVAWDIHKRNGGRRRLNRFVRKVVDEGRGQLIQHSLLETSDIETAREVYGVVLEVGGEARIYRVEEVARALE